MSHHTLPRPSALLDVGWKLARRLLYARYRLGAAAVIVNRAGEVLLVQHNYARQDWTLPGGAADPRESITATARREVREETGLEVTAEYVTGIYYEADLDMLNLVFWCVTPDGRFDLRPGKREIRRCAFWPPDDLPRPISDYTILRIQDALNGGRYPLPVEVGPHRWIE